MPSQELVNVPNRRLLDEQFVAQIVGQPIEEYSISAGAKPGDNVMGTLLCVDVKTASKDIHHLVIKSVLPMSGVIDKYAYSSSKFIAVSRAFPNEITYYKVIQPMFQKVHQENPQWLSIFSGPKNYSCLHDKTRMGMHDYLVLEDLRPNGYKMVDKHVGLNYEEVVSTLKQLALLHATSYSLLNGNGKLSDEFKAIRKDPASITNLHGWAKDIIPVLNMESFFDDIVFKMIELVKEDGQVEMAEKIEKISKDGHKRLMMGIWNKTSDNGKYFRVLVHGDLWTNNVLFKRGPDGKSVLDVKFIDFQMNHFGNIYEDLHYFIFTSTTRDFRKANLKSSLQSYYQEFEKVLQELKCPLPTGFTEEQLISTFYETLDYGFVYNIMAIPYQLGLPAPTTSPIISSKVNSTNEVDEFEPNFQEILDSTVVDLQKSARNSPIALKRLYEMIDEMVDFGVIV